MSYQLLVSKEQLTRIHAALSEYDSTHPADLSKYEGVARDDMELLTDTIGSVLAEPEGDDILHGVCL